MTHPFRKGERKLSLGSVGHLGPHDEICLADECVRRHGKDMRGMFDLGDPSADKIGAVDEPFHTGLDVHEPSQDDDFLGESIDFDLDLDVVEPDLSAGFDL